MNINDVTPVSEVRRDLSNIIRSFAPTVVGSHGKAEAVIMPVAVYRAQVPPEPVIETLLVSAAIAQANFVLSYPQPGRDNVHPGDPLGKIVSWLWQSGQEGRLSLFFADYMAQLRDHDPARNPERLVTLDQILGGLPSALPYDFPPESIPFLIQHLRDTVPAMYGGDPNTPTA